MMVKSCPRLAAVATALVAGWAGPTAVNAATAGAVGIRRAASPGTTPA